MIGQKTSTFSINSLVVKSEFLITIIDNACGRIKPMGKALFWKKSDDFYAILKAPLAGRVAIVFLFAHLITTDT